MTAPRVRRGASSRSDSPAPAAPARVRPSDTPHPQDLPRGATHGPAAGRGRRRFGGRPARTIATLARCTAAGLLALAALLAAPAEAQTTFVSNIGQTDGNLGFANASARGAQQFTTGSNTGGYALSEITVHIALASSAAVPALSIHTSVNGDQGGHTIDYPGSKVVDLTGSVATVGEQSFTPVSATTLSASTKYFVVLSTTADDLYMRYTNSNNVDAGAAAGWGIQNTALITNAGVWGRHGPSIEIAVKGTAVGANTAPPAPTGLTATARRRAGCAGVDERRRRRQHDHQAPVPAEDDRRVRFVDRHRDERGRRDERGELHGDEPHQRHGLHLRGARGERRGQRRGIERGERDPGGREHRAARPDGA